MEYQNRRVCKGDLEKRCNRMDVVGRAKRKKMTHHFRCDATEKRFTSACKVTLLHAVSNSMVQT